MVRFILFLTMAQLKVVRIDRSTQAAAPKDTRYHQTAPKPKPITIDSGNHRARVLARRDELVEQHLSLAEGIARQISRTLPATSFPLEDLVATGNLALVRAATRYRPGAHDGAPFSAYARNVIRGAILDSVRRKNWQEATQQADDEVEVISLPSQEQSADARRLARQLREAMSWLDPAERKVLQTYYGSDEPNLRDVAERLGQPYTRTWQMHAAAVAALRRRFQISGVKAA